MARPQVNGDIPNAANNSSFINHLMDYPLISDGVHTFRTNEYGQRTIRLSDSVYQTFAAPVIPYLRGPYGYISPYVTKADNLGDRTLSQIDERFPAVKKPTGELYNQTRGIILLPYHMGLEGRDHVFHVYDSEVKKSEQHGLYAHGRAAVTTVLVVSNETLSWLSSCVSAKKAQTTQAVNDKIHQ